MLWRMLLHGSVAAILIGSAAAVYSQATGNDVLPSTMSRIKLDDRPSTDGGNGYFKPFSREARTDDQRRERSGKSERHGKDRERRHGKDDD